MNTLKSILFLCIVSFLSSNALTAQTIDTGYYYRLTNSFLGEERALDTYSNAGNEPFMAEAGNYSGQYWKLTPIGNGYFRLTNMFLGDERALDTYSNAGNKPFMAKTGNYSGQFWKLTPTGNGYYRLTNMFLESGRSLDTYSNAGNKPFMGETGNYSGQLWKLTPLKKIPNSVSTKLKSKKELEKVIRS